MGAGQHPLGNASDVPHFDRDGHFNSQEKQEQRRRKRAGKGDRSVGDLPPGTLAMFVVVGGIVSIGVFVPSLIFERFSRTGKKDHQ